MSDTRRAYPFYLLAFGLLAGCGGDEPPAPEPESAADSPASFLPTASAAASDCSRDGAVVNTELFGRLAGPIRWEGKALRCEGMPRPDGAGARLRFAGTAGGQPIAFIVALPGLEPGSTAEELPSNVTLIEEGRGRFFSTPDLDTCWTDVEAQERVTDSRFAIDGRVYCIAPLVEINGADSVTIAELEFRGLVDWDAK